MVKIIEMSLLSLDICSTFSIKPKRFVKIRKNAIIILKIGIKFIPNIRIKLIPREQEHQQKDVLFFLLPIITDVFRLNRHNF